MFSFYLISWWNRCWTKTNFDQCCACKFSKCIHKLLHKEVKFLSYLPCLLSTRSLI